MLAAFSFLINIRVGGVALHASEPIDAASHSPAACLELCWRRFSQSFWHLFHLFSYLLLCGVNPSLSFATSCILWPAHLPTFLSLILPPNFLACPGEARPPLSGRSDQIFARQVFLRRKLSKDHLAFHILTRSFVASFRGRAQRR